MKRCIKIVVFCLSICFSVITLAEVVAYKNGQRIKLDVSKTNPNFVKVDGDIITRIDFLDREMSFTGTDGGGAIIVINNPEPFTFFIQTKKGLTIPVVANAIENQGFYYEIIPSVINASPVPVKWEKSNYFETRLIDVAKLILSNSQELISEKPKGELPKFNLNQLRVVPKAMFVGNKLNVVHYQINNTSHRSQTISEHDFEGNSVKAVFFNTSDLTIPPKKSLDAYLILGLE